MRNKSTLVSVILPNFNAARFLSRSILSVLNQTYKNLELIIVDDCSTDSSLKIIKSFAKKDQRIRYFITKKNSGSASLPKNLGISKTRGEYLAFLDADDYWMSDKLHYQMSRISNYLFSFTAANYQRENSLKKSNFLINYLRVFLQIFFISRVINSGNHWLCIYNPFIMSSAIVKKNVFKKYIFNTDINFREDLSYWLNIFKKYKKKIIFHPKILLTITRSKKSVTSDKILEFNKIINSIANYFLFNEKKKFKFFIYGILFRIFKNISSVIYSSFRKNIYSLSMIFFLFYCIIYYTPLFWLFGQKLIFYNNQKKTEAVLILTGHQGFDYYNNSYLERFIDINYYLQKYNAKQDTKIFILGKLSAIPEQKILEAMLFYENVKKDNIQVIYKEYNNSYLAMKLLEETLREYKISSITIITSPYHSFRLKNLWYQVSGDKYDTVFFKSVAMPKKNNFFERSMNKKEIIYEIFVNFFYKIKYKY